jgi:hypothetical protein
MKKQNRGLSALASDLQMKKGELLEMLGISRSHAHLIEKHERSMPKDAYLVSSSLQLALAQSGKKGKTQSAVKAFQPKDIQKRLSELNSKIIKINRRIEKLSEKELARMKALEAIKLWEIEPNLPKSKREILMDWKKYHIRRLETSETPMDLAAARTRLVGLTAELEKWKNLG